MNKDIIQFLQKNTCASICCLDGQGNPYCFSCFYAINCDEALLYFKSSADSHHAVMMINNPHVAGTILPDRLNKLLVKGLQFEGIVLKDNDRLNRKDLTSYYKENPAALVIPGDIWSIQINNIKMTDSTKLFGQKTTWKREEQTVRLLNQ